MIQLLEIVGEAAWEISETVRANHPEIPWQKMTGMRHRLIHGCFSVNRDLVWATVTRELPPMLKQLPGLLKEMNKIIPPDMYHFSSR